ncbi:protein ecdysoneless homolog [Olea europaea var. sylvestris]|uniref:protein ecdysoneless homolog n=1 Tax=Olea europaea var. sylvestris TaxID=158386 RepID=UPI000C1D3B99|nr:protein ecdysoneless homolog [Olea europaea var. sylvestris]
MAAPTDANSSSSSSIFSLKNSRPPDDTVFYSIFPDSSLTASAAAPEELQSLHPQILNHLTPYTAPYIWQHQPFTLSPSFNPVPHLSGHLRFGDNLEDEWFVVFLLRLMEKAEEYYRNSSLQSRASEMLSSPVRRIDEILALPHLADDFKVQELPPSDDDSWLYGGEDELNAALQERQKEMELYDLKNKKKQKSKEQQDGDPASTKDLEEYDLGDIAKSMQAFVKKVSSYKGAEVPENRNMKDVNFDVDQFVKDMESVMRQRGSGDTDSDPDLEEEPLSDMDFDESDDESVISEDNEDTGDTFMQSYSDALNEELKATTLKKTFVRANEQSVQKKDEGTSNAMEEMTEFTPVDVDINLVQNLLDSFSTQQGLPGPASNLLGLMGLKLPDDSGQGK